MAAVDRRGDAGQAFPLYITAVAALLFLALAFFAVGKAGATRNAGQTAADAAALAAAQDYRDALRTGFVAAIANGSAWQDLLDGRGLGVGDACAEAQWFAGRNDADVTRCLPGFLPASFTVTVRTRGTVGTSVIPGTEHRHATASAKAVVEPRCVHRPGETPTEPSEDTGEPGDGGKDEGEDDKDKEEKPPIELLCDGRSVRIDPEHLDLFPDAKDLFTVLLAE